MRTERSCSPLAALIEQARKVKFGVLPASSATQLLSSHIDRALTSDQSGGVASVLADHGWDGGAFASDVNVHQLIDSLQKYRFERIKELGKGSYAVVYKARNRETNEVIALKKMRLVCGNQGVPPWALREVNALKELKHENIIELKDVVFTFGSNFMYMVLECMDCDLRTYMFQCKENASLSNVKRCLYQLLLGISHAHTNCVMHRDLKPQNILVDSKKGVLKIADFGLSRSFLPSARAYSEKVVTLWYRAPELLLGAPTYTQAVDLWSIACIFAEMVNGQPLFMADCEVALLHCIFQILGTPSPSEWNTVDELAYFRQDFPRWPRRQLSEVLPRLADDPVGLHLISQMLLYEPQLRISASQALLHPWFDDLRPMASSQGTADYRSSPCSSDAFCMA